MAPSIRPAAKPSSSAPAATPTSRSPSTAPTAPPPQPPASAPTRPLHSGHYGNWAPNPAMMLVQLLAGMKDSDGHVLIPHFYDGIAPLGPLEKQALATAPVNDDMLRQELALGHTDGGGKHLLELLNPPSLNINGISSGQTGAHSTDSIPPTATANLD